MLSRNQAKYINSLKISKFRNASLAFLAEGPKLVDEILKSDLEIKSIYALKTWFDSQRGLPASIDCQEINEGELNKVSALKTPNQVLAIVKIPDHDVDIDDLHNNLVLALDDIRDPGNMGTIIRTADWFGVKQVFCSRECVDAYNPKVVQATMGSVARVKIHYADLVDFLGQHAKDLSIYGATTKGRSIYEETLSGQGIILIGNESKGLAEALHPLIDRHIAIPAPGAALAESLNASIATAIILSEFRRQNTLSKQN